MATALRCSSAGGRGDLPGGHADPHRLARQAQARGRPAGARERRAGRADRGHGYRARARGGWRIKPVKVTCAAAAPLTFPRVEDPSPFLAGEVTERIWPCVQLQWEWLGGLPPLRTAAVLGAGSMGTALAARARARGPRGAARLPLARRRPSVARPASAGPGYLPARRTRPLRSRSCTVPEIELAGVDLVVLAVPVRGAAGAGGGDRRARWASAAPCSSSPRASCRRSAPRPRAYVVGTRPRARRGLARRAGHADEASSRGRPVVLATARRRPAPAARRRPRRGGLTSTPPTTCGRRARGCAKNAAALASAAAASRGANLAGTAAGRVFSEVHRLALASGGRSETFAGLAGAGDLLATALAEGSRNRRAGELVAAGSPGQVEGILEQTAESLATVPLLDQAFERKGIEAPVTTGLRDVLDGRASPDSWLERVRSGSPSPASRAA